MARSTWDGTLIFAGFPIALKAYSLVSSSASFKTLCKCHGAPINAPKVCATSRKELDDIDQQKGVEVSKDNFVVVDTNAIANATKTSSIEPLVGHEFSPLASVPLHLSEKAYRMVAGPGFEKSVAILWNALKDGDLALVSEWVPRAGSRETLIVLHAGALSLLANTLPYVEQFSDAPAGDVSRIAVAPNERQMFDTAISTLYTVAPFAHDGFTSTYAARRQAAIDAAVAGKPIPAAAAAPAAPAVPDLMAALAASLEAVQPRKEAVPA